MGDHPDRVELLAPAGTREAFVGALNAGADAVYLGGQRFGARAYADNFSDEEIVRAIEEAHVFGRKVYLTVNILTREDELPELVAFVRKLYLKGLDGVIVQDLGVLRALYRECPGLPLHASTQLSVTSSESVQFLRRLGVTRVVPARELSLTEIGMLRREDAALNGQPIEVEAFIHGAMCYSYSGRCLMSSFLGGRSGNRGRCAGTCRLPARILDEQGRPAGPDARKKEVYPLSMKDMCVLRILPELIDEGICSFKIEGRMKKPVYAAGVTAIYRKYIDRCYAWMEAGRPTPWEVEEEDLEKLRSLYIRTSLGTGYYHARNGRDLVTIGKPGYAGTDVVLEEEIREKYLGGLPGVEISGRAVFRVGEPAELYVSARRSDRNPEKALENGLNREYGTDSKDKTSAGIDSVSAVSRGAVVQKASGRPMEKEDLEARLRKTGDSLFVFSALDIESDECIFLPVSAVNALRRDALQQLKDLLSSKENLERSTSDKNLSETVSPEIRADENSGEDPARSTSESILSEIRIPDPLSEKSKPEDVERTGPAAHVTPGIGRELWALVSNPAQLEAAAKAGCACILVDGEFGPGAVSAGKQFEVSAGKQSEASAGKQSEASAGKQSEVSAGKQSGMAGAAYISGSTAADPMSVPASRTGKDKNFSGNNKNKGKKTQLGNISALKSQRIRLIRVLPPVFRVYEREKIRRMIADAEAGGFSGIMVRTLEELETARQMRYGGEIIADASLYTWNRRSMELIAADCDRIVCSLELNQATIREAILSFAEKGGEADPYARFILPVYGRVPMMETAGCVRKTENMCTKQDGFWYLEDRMGKRLPVRCRCGTCSNTIYNAVPLSLHQFAGQGLMERVPVHLCMFTTETAAQTGRILAFFDSLTAAGEKTRTGKKPDPDFQAEVSLPGKQDRKDRRGDRRKAQDIRRGKKGDNRRPAVNPPFTEFTNGHFKTGAL